MTTSSGSSRLVMPKHHTWWEMPKSTSHTEEYTTFESFIATAERMTTEHAVGVKVLPSSFGLGALLGVTDKKPQEYKLANLKPVMTERQWKRLCELQGQMDKLHGSRSRMPVLTFHGSKSIDAINSIVKHGYLLPGDVHPVDGHVLRMENGSYYGDGVYTSQQFGTSWLYSAPDDCTAVQVIVNVVVLGASEFVYPDGAASTLAYRCKEEQASSSSARTQRRVKEEVKDVVTPSQSTLSHFGKSGLIVPTKWSTSEDADDDDDMLIYYDDQRRPYHTRVIQRDKDDLGNVIVSASAKYVFPLFVAEYKSCTDWSKIGTSILLKGKDSRPYLGHVATLPIPLTSSSNPSVHVNKKDMSFTMTLDGSTKPILKDSDPKVMMHHLGQDLYCLDLLSHRQQRDDDDNNKHSSESVKTKVRHDEAKTAVPCPLKIRTHWLMPTAWHKKHRLQGYIRTLFDATTVSTSSGTVCKDAWAYFYNDASLEDVQRVPNKDAWKGMVDAHKYTITSGGEQASSSSTLGVLAAFDACLDKVTKSEVAAHEDDVVDLVYCFCPSRSVSVSSGEAEVVATSFEALITKYEAWARSRSMALKLILNGKEPDHDDAAAIKGPALLSSLAQPLLRLKSRLIHSIEGMWEQRRIHYIPLVEEKDEVEEEEETIGLLGDVFGQLQSEVDQLKHLLAVRAGVQVSVELTDRYVGEGIVTDLLAVPQWKTDVPFSRYLLFKGAGHTTTSLRINDVVHRVCLVGTKDPTAVEASSWSMMVEGALESVLTVLAKFRNHVLSSHFLLHRYEPIISLLCRTILTKAIDETAEADTTPQQQSKGQKNVMMQRLASIVGELSSLGSVPFSGKWYYALNDLRFKRGIIRRSKLVSGLDDDGDDLVVDGCTIQTRRTDASSVEPWILRIESVFPERTDAMDRKRGCAGDSKDASTHGRDVLWLPRPPGGGSSLVDGVHRRRPPPQYYARIFTGNPHLFLPSQVAALPTIAFVRVVEQMLQCSWSTLSSPSPLKSATSLTSIDKDGKEDKAPLGGVRISDSENEGRCRALADVAWDLFHYQLCHLRDLKKIGTSLASTLSGGGASTGTFQDILSETHGIVSTCMLLGGLCTEECKPIFVASARTASSSSSSTVRYSQFAFALLAESIMRDCRAHVRCSSDDDKFTHIERVLGLRAMSSSMTSATFDWTRPEHVRRACLRTSRIAQKAYTNASPFAVIAVLEMVERLHAQVSKEDIVQTFLKGNVITPKQFLLRHLPPPQLATSSTGMSLSSSLSSSSLDAKKVGDVHGEEQRRLLDWGSRVQLALYLQGLRYQKAKVRDIVLLAAASAASSTGCSASSKSSSTFDPDRIIKDIATETMQRMQKRQEYEARLVKEKDARFLRRFEEGKRFLEFHTMPVLFDYAQVDRLNASRPPDDQLELLPESGLLRHHCCYPDCPDFLRNFATTGDRMSWSLFHKGKTRQPGTRKGLMNHFAFDQNCLNIYTPGFHILGRAVFKQQQQPSWTMTSSLAAAPGKLESWTQDFMEEMHSRLSKQRWYRHNSTQHLDTKLRVLFKQLWDSLAS